MELTKKKAAMEISGMVSSLKRESLSNPSWCECLREVGRKMPTKWCISPGNPNKNWSSSYYELMSLYEKIDKVAGERNVTPVSDTINMFGSL